MRPISCSEVASRTCLAGRYQILKEVYMGLCGQGQVKGFGGNSERRVTRIESKAYNFILL